MSILVLYLPLALSGFKLNTIFWYTVGSGRNLIIYLS